MSEERPDPPNSTIQGTLLDVAPWLAEVFGLFSYGENTGPNFGKGKSGIDDFDVLSGTHDADQKSSIDQLNQDLSDSTISVNKAYADHYARMAHADRQFLSGLLLNRPDYVKGYVPYVLAYPSMFITSTIYSKA